MLLNQKIVRTLMKYLSVMASMTYTNITIVMAMYTKQ